MTDPAFLAKRLLDVIPPLMHQIRVEMRRSAQDRLTVPQFRILAQLRRGSSQVGKIAEHQGVSQPAMSKMIDGLVLRGLIERTSHSMDRRQVVLRLSKKGSSLFHLVRKKAQVGLATRLQEINSTEQKNLLDALTQIESIFAKNRDSK